MTLRRLLHSLASDDDARAELLADPDAALLQAGFEDLDDGLIGTALVHHADAAPLSEVDALMPLLDRFVPLSGGDRLAAADEPLEPPFEFALATDGDPGHMLDDLEALDEPSAGTSVDPDTTDHDYGTGAGPITVSDLDPPGSAPPVDPLRHEPDGPADVTIDHDELTVVDLSPLDPEPEDISIDDVGSTDDIDGSDLVG